MGDRPLQRCWLARRGPRPPDWETCAPCAAREDHQWLVTAGTHVALVRASCETGARETVAWRLYPDRARARLPLERVVAKPASDADVERFEQMMREHETRA